MAELANPDALPVGSVLLEYRIKEVLGADGFGIKYLAHDTILQRSVTIKEYFPADLAVRGPDGRVMPLGPTTEASYSKGLSQFMVETRALARFVHPSIVRIDRGFEANGTAYMLTEHEAGESLAEQLDAAPQPDEAMLKSLLRPLLDGLGAVHAAGVLHRDIKPASIVVRPDGSPVLMDFGAARLASRDALQDIIPILTPGYAAVEQYIDSGGQGPWSDIYSVAAVLFWAVTGEPPPDALSRLRLDNVGKQLNAARMWYSGPFIDAIQWGLAVQPDQRPRTVDAWAAALFRETPAKATAGAALTASDATRKYVWVALGIVIFYLFVAGADIVKQRAEQRMAMPTSGPDRAAVADRSPATGENARPAATQPDAGLSRDEVVQNLPHLTERFNEIDVDRSGRLSTEELQSYFRRKPAAPK